MFTDVREFWFPRDENKPRAYEDAYCLDSRSGLVAIADGVAGGAFSAAWANILTRATVEDPPNPESDTFAEWLAANREEWKSGIDITKLDYFQQKKLREVGGGYSTLLWLDLRPVGDDDPQGETETYRCMGCAIGDCCFYHVRDGEVLNSFPLTESSQFDLTPPSIGSTNMNQDQHLPFELLDDYCRPGDLLVLATDAIACHLMKQLEQGTTIDWEALLDMDDEQWTSWIRELRAANAIRIDDTTLVLLPVAAPVAAGDIPNAGDNSYRWSGELFTAVEQLEDETEPVDLDASDDQVIDEEQPDNEEQSTEEQSSDEEQPSDEEHVIEEEQPTETNQLTDETSTDRMPDEVSDQDLVEPSESTAEENGNLQPVTANIEASTHSDSVQDPQAEVSETGEQAGAEVETTNTEPTVAQPLAADEVPSSKMSNGREDID